LAPLVTCILAKIFLAETMKKIDMVQIIIIFVGVLLVILGSADPTHIDSKSNDLDHKPWYAYLGLVFVPLGMGSSNVLMRKMKKIHFVTLGVYKYAFSLPMLLLAYSTVYTFRWSLFSDFYFFDYLLILCAALA